MKSPLVFALGCLPLTVLAAETAPSQPTATEKPLAQNPYFQPALKFTPVPVNPPPAVAAQKRLPDQPAARPKARVIAPPAVDPRMPIKEPDPAIDPKAIVTVPEAALGK